jgi:hypothetical protein
MRRMCDRDFAPGRVFGCLTIGCEAQPTRSQVSGFAVPLTALFRPRPNEPYRLQTSLWMVVSSRRRKATTRRHAKSIQNSNNWEVLLIRIGGHVGERPFHTQTFYASDSLDLKGRVPRDGYTQLWYHELGFSLPPSNKGGTV